MAVLNRSQIASMRKLFGTGYTKEAVLALLDSHEEIRELLRRAAEYDYDLEEDRWAEDATDKLWTDIDGALL